MLQNYSDQVFENQEHDVCLVELVHVYHVEMPVGLVLEVLVVVP